MISLHLFFCAIFSGSVETEKVSQEISLKYVDHSNPPEIGATISLDRDILIRSLCLRFRLISLSTQTLFHSKEIALTINFSENYGFLLLNGKWQIFSIPYKPVPKVYQHFCFTHNKTHYFVASEGKLWFQTPFFPKDIGLLNENSHVDTIEFGPMSKEFTGYGMYFSGKISELNMFSETFSVEELVAITGSCENIEREKAFDWSKIKVLLQISKHHLPLSRSTCKANISGL